MSTRSEPSTRSAPIPRSLVVGVLLLALAVLVLGGAVLAVKLRPDASTASAADRELQGWQQAVADEPKSDVAQTGLGLALLDAGRLSDAQAAFEEALRLNPENWMANFQLGLMMRESQPDRALDLLDLAAKNAEPGDKAVPLIAAGDIMLERGDAEGARDAYRRSIADVSYLFDSHLGLAKALEQLGETQDALEEYRSAARFAPDDPEVQAAIDRLKEQL